VSNVTTTRCGRVVKPPHRDPAFQYDDNGPSRQQVQQLDDVNDSGVFVDSKADDQTDQCDNAIAVGHLIVNTDNNNVVLSPDIQRLEIAATSTAVTVTVPAMAAAEALVQGSTNEPSATVTATAATGQTDGRPTGRARRKARLVSTSTARAIGSCFWCTKKFLNKSVDAIVQVSGQSKYHITAFEA
jgi:hypothetical protein